MGHELNKKEVLYYARMQQSTNIYEVLEIKVRTVEVDYFVATEKREKHAFLFYYDDIDNIVFFDREDALAKVKEAEKHKSKTISDETDYEEY